MYFFKFWRNSHGLKMLRKILLFPFGLLYGIILQCRNIFFDLGLIKSRKTAKPSISVGNLSMGGTGKTPAIKFLLEAFGSQNTVVISRGYGRQSKGLLEVKTTSPTSESGDEPLEIKKEYPEALVLVAEKRLDALNHLENRTSSNLFLFDDLYQHRYVQARCNILLSSYHTPFYKDMVLPAGNLREFPFNKHRADLLVITKCPNNLSQQEAVLIAKRCRVSVPVFFSCQVYEKTQWLKPLESNKNVIALSSIAQASDFLDEVKKHHEVLKVIKKPDHYCYTQNDVEEIIGLANKLDCNIVTTAKDMSKLYTFAAQFDKINLGYIPVKMHILFGKNEDYIQHIKDTIQ